MTKHTQEQLLAMTNEQLDEIVALAQGWTLHASVDDITGYEEFYVMRPSDDFCCKEGYHPSTNKEQAWDLAFKCKLFIYFENSTELSTGDAIHAVESPNEAIGGDIEHKDPLIAVTIAAILHLQESE